MEKNIIIPNPEKLEKIKKAISEGEAEKLHILSDFDSTLTQAFVNGKKVPSLIWILYNKDYLTPDYNEKAQQLHKKYHAIEINNAISREEKRKAMEEWWTKHFNLLIKSGLNKKEIKAVIDSGLAKLREGFLEFFDILEVRHIPLVIMSSSGLGGDAISMFLEREGKFSENINIISNSFIWDEDGNAVGVKQPIIHGMNKKETMVKDFPEVYEKIKNRKNVILLGDNTEDVEMIEGFDYDNLLKIGFLNERAEENLGHYKKIYDVIILNDSPMDFVNNLLEEIII